jgi:hypothetical protein
MLFELPVPIDMYPVGDTGTSFTLACELPICTPLMKARSVPEALHTAT